MTEKRFKVAILDDYQDAALKVANWDEVRKFADIKVFNDHEARASRVVTRLAPFDVVVVMRERTPMRAEVIDQLPKLKLICSTGARNASIDEEAASRNGVVVMHTGYNSTPTIEMAWALIQAAARNLVGEHASVVRGGWQTSIGTTLKGSTLGIVGLGNIGSEISKIGNLFGMQVLAWSPNLTSEKAALVGATCVDKHELFARSDFVSIHLVLSDRSRGTVGDAELAEMKSSAWIINTSRGPIVEEAALLAALRSRRIRGAALDVFDVEPLPKGHPFRSLDNVILTPHIGYVADRLYETFYGDCVTNIVEWARSRG